MTTAEANAVDLRREQRVRRLSLVVVGLLVPVAFAASSWRSFEDYLRGRELFATKVPPGGSASYAGAVWRLSGFKVITGSADPRLAMPSDRALVSVRLAAATTRDIGKDWFVCRFTLRDGDGRRWTPLSILLPNDLERLIAPGGEAAPGCGPVALARPGAGAKVMMEEKFLVPRAALATLTARFSVPAERPWALAFPLETR